MTPDPFFGPTDKLMPFSSNDVYFDFESQRYWYDVGWGTTTVEQALSRYPGVQEEGMPYYYPPSVPSVPGPMDYLNHADTWMWFLKDVTP